MSERYGPEVYWPGEEPDKVPKEKPDEKSQQILLKDNLVDEIRVAFRNHDVEQANTLKGAMEKRHPDELELIEVLSRFPEFLTSSNRIDLVGEKEQKIGSERGTEYLYTLTDYVIRHSDDPEYLTLFWDKMRLFSKAVDRKDEFEWVKYGVLAPVALFKALKKNGGSPTLSTPHEDAVVGIDMWATPKVPVQIKFRNKGLAINLVELAKVLPGEDIMTEKGLEDYRDRFEAYGIEKGVKYNGYYIEVPRAHIDPTTGEPSDEFVAVVAQMLPKKDAA